MDTNISREQLYKDYRGKVLAYISSRVSSREDAEDLCEEVFVKLFKKLGSLEGEDSAPKMLFKLSHDIVIDHYRTHREHEELSEEQASVSAAEDIVLDQETSGILKDALLGLPPQLRDIIVLRFYEKQTLVKIAEKMGITYNVAVNRQNKALDILRRKLRDIR